MLIYRIRTHFPFNKKNLGSNIVTPLCNDSNNDTKDQHRSLSNIYDGELFSKIVKI